MEEPLEMIVSDSGSGLTAFLARFDCWSSIASLRAIFIILGLLLATSWDSLCQLRVYHCWKDYSKPMGTSPVGLGEVYSWAIS